MNLPVKKVYSSSAPFNGILKYIRDYAGSKSLSWKSFYLSNVSSTQSYYQSSDYPVTRDVDGGTLYWASNYQGNNYFSVEFNDTYLLLESYVHRAYSSDYHPEWQILGSDDGVKWEIICNPRDFQQPSGSYVTLNFQCQASAPYRIIKYLPTQKRFAGDNCLVFYGLEFFGTLYPIKTRTLKNIATCYNGFDVRDSMLMLLALVSI
jgi:hypothetical protein